jgi:hypothetical protein
MRNLARGTGKNRVKMIQKNNKRMRNLARGTGKTRVIMIQKNIHSSFRKITKE